MAVSPFNVAYEKYAKENTGSQLVVLAIEAGDSYESIMNAYITNNKQLYPAVNDGISIFAAFGCTGTPTAVLVKPDRSFAFCEPALRWIL